MSTQTRHKSAQLLYRPVGLAGSVAGGLVAGKAFKQVYKHAVPGSADHAPTALEGRFGIGQVVLGAALQGAVFAAVKAAVDRAGARAFQRWTGEWPGS